MERETYNVGVAVGPYGVGAALVQAGTSDVIIYAGRCSSALLALAAVLERTPVGSYCIVGTNDASLLAAISPPYTYRDQSEWWAAIRAIAMRRIKRILVSADRLPRAMEFSRNGDEITLPQATLRPSAVVIQPSVRTGRRRRPAGDEQLAPSLLPDWTDR